MPLGEETKTILTTGKGRAVERSDEALRQLVQAGEDARRGRRGAARRLKAAQQEALWANAVMQEWEG